MAVIGISVGHGGSDPGATAYNGKTEAYYNLEIGKRLKAILERAGHTVIASRDRDVEGGEVKFAKAIDGKVDFALAIHFNAFNASAQGSEVGVNPVTSAEHKNAYRLATSIIDRVTSACPGLNKRGVVASSKNGYDFAMLRYSYPCAYVESLFCDAPSAANWIGSSAKLDRLAQAIADGVLSVYVPINKTPEPEPKTETRLVYRVVAGSYADKKNAIAQQAKLKAAGFASFLAAYDETV